LFFLGDVFDGPRQFPLQLDKCTVKNTFKKLFHKALILLLDAYN